MSAWQPIGTAPKDRRPIIVYDADCDAPGEAFWEPEREAFFWANTHWTDAAGHSQVVRPTHWQPMPDDPPELSATKEGA
jgi:hypothetical protein